RQSALRRAHGEPGRSRRVLSEARRRAQAALRRLALLFLYRRPAAAEADPARALGAYAALERGDRVPPLRVPDGFRSSYANLSFFQPSSFFARASACSSVRSRRSGVIDT